MGLNTPTDVAPVLSIRFRQTLQAVGERIAIGHVLPEGGTELEAQRPGHAWPLGVKSFKERDHNCLTSIYTNYDEQNH